MLATGTTVMKGLWRLLEPLARGEIKREAKAEMERLRKAVEPQA